MSAEALEQIDLRGLTGPQQEGWNCALCNARLFADRSLGVYRVVSCGQESRVELWACRPDCRTAARNAERLHAGRPRLPGWAW
ncbi:hypothetical protein ACH4OW_26350 [Streptomyces sp. NPDC017056]|uniref:hypothetical protein n=1 Tax=Streptomyces sp. NPDC017056 TaxID=3364973 RepID=UPI0037AB6DF7